MSSSPPTHFSANPIGLGLSFHSVAPHTRHSIEPLSFDSSLHLQYPPPLRLSPEPVFHPSFSPSTLSSSWSHGHLFSSPGSTMTASSSDPRLFPASFSSSSSLSLSDSSFSLYTPSGTIDPAYLTAPLSHDSREDAFTPQGFRRADGESPAKSYIRHLSRGYPSIPCSPSPTTRLSPKPPVSRPRPIKRKSSTQDAPSEQSSLVAAGSPIFDAHRGISQDELEAKARRCRLRFPDVEVFDSRWLASFTGKLSAHGEMIDQFRCYVVGCTQTNKRRDHMVVHVGSHLDQKQYKCPQWQVVYSPVESRNNPVLVLHGLRAGTN
ncbi:hypothetical protein FB45DRAFT_405550 [Roridomyces roridus]|uniref:C2H2-type domain-containing protein n=1 Tax=Roridomyces roridus TaxID=1738132 RepID=A0AAD7C487_9AGAR|nr:hypothetical protein FB45DRAFT_405550 [Roridomyces roridus]